MNRTQDAAEAGWHPRNPVERWLGYQTVEVIERAFRGAPVADDDLRRALERVYVSATSRAPYRPRNERQRVAYYEVAIPRAVEAIRGGLPGKRRAKSDASHVRNAMQTGIKDWQKTEAAPEFTTAGFDGLLASGIGRREQPNSLVDLDLDADTRDLRSGLAPALEANELVYVDDDRSADEVREDVSAEVNTVEADERPTDRFGAAISAHGRIAKVPGSWSVSEPGLPDAATDPLTMEERWTRTVMDREATDVAEFDRALASASRWRAGDPPVQISSWGQRRRDDWRGLAYDVLAGAQARLHRESQTAEHWMRSATRQATVANYANAYAGEQSGETQWRRLQRRERERRYTGPLTPVRRGYKRHVPAIKQVRDAATSREQALFDAASVKRGGRDEVGISTLAQAWGETRGKLRREAARVMKEFERRALEVELAEADAQTPAAPARYVADPEPEPIDLRHRKWERPTARMAALKRALDDRQTA